MSLNELTQSEPQQDRIFARGVGANTSAGILLRSRGETNTLLTPRPRAKDLVQALLPSSPNLDGATSTVSHEVQGVKAAGELLATITRFVEAGRRTDALDLVCDRIDDLLLERAYDRVRWIIDAASQLVERDTVPLSVFLSILTITKPWSRILSEERGHLAERFRVRAARDRGEDAARQLLLGLL